MKLLSKRAKTHTPRFHVVTIDAVTGQERTGRFGSAQTVPSFIGVPDMFSRPSFTRTPDWPATPVGYQQLTRGTTGSPDDVFFRHYFIFERQD